MRGQNCEKERMGGSRNGGNKCRQDVQEGYLHREGKELGLAKSRDSYSIYNRKEDRMQANGSGNWVVWVVWEFMRISI